jgi:protein required for attachment to host cells
MKRVCVAVIDAAHARYFRYVRTDAGHSSLEEVADKVSPGRQAHGMFADKPSRGNSPGVGVPRASTLDDHRTDHIAELDTRFAKEIVADLTRIIRDEEFAHLIVVASPKMLGRVRPELVALRKSGIGIDEIPQDLTRLTSPQMHDHLAALHVIDPRPGAQLRAAPRSR